MTLKITFAVVSVVLLVACAAAPAVSPAVRSDLAPNGTLRAAINYANPVLAQGSPAAGDLRGITVDLSRELARRIGVPVELVPYDAAGKMTDAVKTGAWDVAFLAVDPARAAGNQFHGTVRGNRRHVPRAGGVSAPHDRRRGPRRRSRRRHGEERLRSFSGPKPEACANRARIVAPESIEVFTSDKLEAMAGVRQALVTASAKIPGSRVLDGRFMVIAQAAGVPKGRDAGAQYLREFIEDAKASGLVAESLKKSGVDGATVAPLAPVQ